MENNLIINPAGNDKVSNFLMSLRGIRLFITIVTALGITILPVLFTLIDGNFINLGLRADAIHDIGNISLYLLGLPTVIYVIAQYSGKFSNVLEQLKVNKVTIMTDSEWVDFKINVNQIFAKQIFTKAPYILASIITLYLLSFYYYNSSKLPAWYSIKINGNIFIAAYLQIPIYFVTFYTFSVCLLNIVASYVVLRKLFNKYKISVQPLHPDNCGGLSPLGALSKKLNSGIILIGIIAGVNIFMNYKLFDMPLFNFFQLIIIIMYILCAYIVFFMPLYAAHESMKVAKYDEIKRINEYFLTVNQKLKDRLNKHENIDQMDMSDFENVNKIYDLAKKMPVYPFNIGTISSFLGSIFIPIFLIVLEKILQQLF